MICIHALLSIFGWRAFLFLFLFLLFHHHAPRTELYVAQLPVLEYNQNYGDNALSEPCDNSRGTAPITNKGPSSEREKSGRVERSTPVFLPGDDERGFERRVGVGSVLAVRRVC
jgi:hypothetical protein